MAAVGGGQPGYLYSHSAQYGIDSSLYNDDGDGIDSPPINPRRFSEVSRDDHDENVQWLASAAFAPPAIVRKTIKTTAAAAAPLVAATAAAAAPLLRMADFSSPLPIKEVPNFFITISKRPISIDSEGKLYKIIMDGIEYHLERLGQGDFNEVFRFLDVRPLKIHEFTIPDLSRCVIKIPLEAPKAPSEASGQLNDTIKGCQLLTDNTSLGCSVPNFYWIPAGAYTREVSYNLSDMTKGRFFITEYIPDASSHLLEEWKAGEGYEELSPRAKKIWDFLQHYCTKASVKAYPLGDLKPANIRFRSRQNEPVVIDFTLCECNLFEDLCHWYVGNEKFLHYVTEGIADKKLKEETREAVRNKFIQAEAIKKNRAELEAETKRKAGLLIAEPESHGDGDLLPPATKKMAVSAHTPRKGLMPSQLMFNIAATAPAAPSNLVPSASVGSPPRRKMTGTRGMPATPAKPFKSVH